jgi:hypothetical protein
MKNKIIFFLRIAFPFLLTVGLWRLSVPFWNPGGILALIPIFFCSFVKPVNWFPVFSILMCFVIDYKFETVCFWVAMYCLFYAINGFQNIIDLTRLDMDGIFAFSVFIGGAILIQVFSDFTLFNLFRGAWLFLVLCAMYLPTTALIKRIYK